MHPDRSNVIPLCPELIQNADGAAKNDCERNASKRFIEHFKREHPHLKVIILGDGIASNAPYIRLLQGYNMKFILGAKPGDHEALFTALEASEKTQYYEISDEKGFLHQFRFLNDAALNKSNPDVRVNVLEYMQTDPKGRETVFSWVTNMHITQTNVFALMKGGRARWKIENETFNTLKNLGYNFEHNYGHGKKFLSTILCLLMLLSFFCRPDSRDDMRSISDCEEAGRVFSGPLAKAKGSLRICGVAFLGISIPIHDGKKTLQHLLTISHVP